jgi:glycosyltransferase involved in cell wall biosynthesis
MAQADVLVVTSAHEGFGIPAIEAMSVGLPVVANRSGALPEVVGGGGVLVDTSDPWALATTITSLFDDAPRRRALAAAAREQLATLDLPGAGDRFVDLVSGLRKG